MSFISPKIFILQNFFNKKAGHRNGNKTKKSRENKETKVTYSLIQKRKYGNALDKYLSLKKMIYFKDLKEQKNLVKKILFNRLNINLNKFVRNKKISDLKLKDGIISKTNNLQNFKIDNTFKKIWKKLTPKNYEKFDLDYNFSQEINKIITREVEEDRVNMRSMMNLKIKQFKDMLGENAFDKKTENENGDIINKYKKDPITFLIKNIANKKNNNINNKSIFKNEKLLFNQVLNNKNKSRSLKNFNVFKNNNNKERGISALSRNKNKKEFEIKRIESNSKLKQFSFFEKIKNKTINKRCSSCKKFTRNKNNNSISFINSETQKSRIIQQYNSIKKSTEKMKLNYLNNHIIPSNKIDSLMKTREDLMIDYLKVKYLKDIVGEKNIFLEKISKHKRPDSFKERLLKSAEIIFNEQEFNI